MKEEKVYRFTEKERRMVVGLLEYRILTLDYWNCPEVRKELRKAKKLAKKFGSKRV